MTDGEIGHRLPKVLIGKLCAFIAYFYLGDSESDPNDFPQELHSIFCCVIFSIGATSTHLKNYHGKVNEVSSVGVVIRMSA